MITMKLIKIKTNYCCKKEKNILPLHTITIIGSKKKAIVY